MMVRTGGLYPQASGVSLVSLMKQSFMFHKLGRQLLLTCTTYIATPQKIIICGGGSVLMYS